jgi:hypothetical protein
MSKKFKMADKFRITKVLSFVPYHRLLFSVFQILRGGDLSKFENDFIRIGAIKVLGFSWILEMINIKYCLPFSALCPTFFSIDKLPHS